MAMTVQQAGAISYLLKDAGAVELGKVAWF